LAVTSDETGLDGDISEKPGPTDMANAKTLYVKLKCKWDSGVEGCPTSIDELRYGLGDGGLTKPWSGMDGLRHKYFTYNKETDTVSGVYVFFSQEKMDAYINTELFASHEQMPHFSKVEAEQVDVMSGTELAIEKTEWPHTPPTREDVTKAKMLIVQIQMNYKTGIEGLPTSKEDFYMFMSTAGMGYPGQFGGLRGLRGKYFAYNAAEERCYGFYTFLDQECLDEYMASDLFKTQGGPPHIKSLTYTVHEVLPGTEIVMDQGAWKSR